MTRGIQKEDPKVWASYPWQKSLIICLSAIVFLFGVIIKSSRDDNEREKERVDNFRSLNKDKELKIETLERELYGCKDETARYFRTQDSTNHAILDLPARELLKQLKK